MNSEELLKSMVEIFSPSCEEKEIAEFLVKKMSELGFKSKVDEAGNAIGEIGSGKTTILLCGHIDTVPGMIPVRIKEGRLYGRGSVDAKGPLAAFIMAASKIKDKKIIVAGCVEEETASSKGARHLLGKYRPDYIIIGEPSGADAVTLGYKGRLLADYKLKMPMAHRAGNQESAVTAAINFCSSLSGYTAAFSQDKKIFDKLDINFRSIHSETDGLYESVAIGIGFRLPLDFETNKLKEFMEENKNNATLAFSGEETAIKSSRANRLVNSFVKAIPGLKFKVKTGTSDMNVLGHFYNSVPILAYGAGDSALDHTPDENIMLEEYRKSIKVLENVLAGL